MGTIALILGKQHHWFFCFSDLPPRFESDQGERRHIFMVSSFQFSRYETKGWFVSYLAESPSPRFERNSIGWRERCGYCCHIEFGWTRNEKQNNEVNSPSCHAIGFMLISRSSFSYHIEFRKRLFEYQYRVRRLQQTKSSALYEQCMQIRAGLFDLYLANREIKCVNQLKRLHSGVN